MEVLPTGKVERIAPLVRRLLAPNPSPFTYTGTWAFIVGSGEVAVIDPGPDIPEHLDAMLDALAGERVAAIVCTHTHRDHSPASRALRAATGAPIVGCAPLSPGGGGDLGDDESFDLDYAPDRVLADGETLAGTGWTLQAVATPGHTSNHLCFALSQSRALFAGDHVMGWSTSIVSPPNGDMAAYMRSLERLLGRDDAIYYPAHGPAVENPRTLVQRLIAHRRHREEHILSLLEEDEATIPEMVEQMYRDIDPRLHPAAARSVLAHLIDLRRRDLVVEEGSSWRHR